MLRVQGLCKSFGTIRALDSVDLHIEKGLIHGIIGPNGSGKTTLFDCISGLQSYDSGKISFEGTEITGIPPDRIARMGVRRTFQGGKVVAGMTVAENVMSGAGIPIRRALVDILFRLPFSASRVEAEVRVKAEDALARVGMRTSAQRWAGTLSWSERQLLQIARALIARPRLLLLDEPGSGMGLHEIEGIARTIREIRDAGVTVVVVSHEMKMLMALSDRVTVLNFGRKIAEGSPEEVRGNSLVLEAYLGAR
jgi:branched-chain amino acid transport system ATP-binding protein